MNFEKGFKNFENTELNNIEFIDEATFIIAESNDLYRLGLQCIIQDQVYSPIILTVTTKFELHSALLSNSAAAVIVDLNSFPINSINEVTVLSACFPQSNWLFVGDAPDETFLLPLTASFGRANFVLKIDDYDIIVTAILATATGKKYYCNKALQIIIDSRNRKKENLVTQNLLTITELELVHLFTQGKTAKEIAELRHLSYHTINTHRKNIFRKLKLNNSKELIRFALKNGLVDLTEYYI